MNTLIDRIVNLSVGVSADTLVILMTLVVRIIRLESIL